MFAVRLLLNRLLGGSRLIPTRPPLRSARDSRHGLLEFPAQFELLEQYCEFTAQQRAVLGVLTAESPGSKAHARVLRSAARLACRPAHTSEPTSRRSWGCTRARSRGFVRYGVRGGRARRRVPQGCNCQRRCSERHAQPRRVCARPTHRRWTHRPQPRVRRAPRRCASRRTTRR